MNRALQTSDLSVSDLTAEISIELPKIWNERFQQKATFKRITKALADGTEDPSNSDPNQGTNTGDNTGGGTDTGSGDDDERPGAGG